MSITHPYLLYVIHSQGVVSFWTLKDYHLCCPGGMNVASSITLCKTPDRLMNFRFSPLTLDLMGKKLLPTLWISWQWWRFVFQHLFRSLAKLIINIKIFQWTGRSSSKSGMHLLKIFSWTRFSINMPMLFFRYCALAYDIMVFGIWKYLGQWYSNFSRFCFVFGN